MWWTQNILIDDENTRDCSLFFPISKTLQRSCSWHSQGHSAHCNLIKSQLLEPDCQKSMTQARICVVWCWIQLHYITIRPDLHDRGYCSSKPPKKHSRNAAHSVWLKAANQQRVLTYDRSRPMGGGRVSHLFDVEWNEWLSGVGKENSLWCI